MKSCIAVSRSRSCAVTRWAGPRNRETPQPRDRKTKSPTPESTWGQIEERIRTCRLFSFFYPGCKRPQINPARENCSTIQIRCRGRVRSAGVSPLRLPANVGSFRVRGRDPSGPAGEPPPLRRATSVPENPLQPAPCPLHLTAAAVDVVGPLAELFE